MTSSQEGGVSCWPEAVQYLLRSYAQSTYISRAINDLRSIKQEPGEDEQKYSKRINDGVSRCRSVHSPEEVITMYTDGLDITVRTIVQRYRENHRRATYLELVQHAKYEGEAVRARGVQPVESDSKSVGIIKPDRPAVNLL